MTAAASRPGGLRIVLDSYLVHYPLGGIVSWVLQFLVGFRRLGHDVYLVEKSPYMGSCYDPRSDTMTDDPGPALARLRPLLARFGLGDRWAYVDSSGRYHGLAGERVAELLRTADVFLEMGTYGDWAEAAAGAACRVLVDGEPAFSQIVTERALAAGKEVPAYDRYYTPGLNIGTPRSSAPTAGREWRPLRPPVLTDVFTPSPPPRGGRFTTVMNWQSHREIEHDGVRYGQKATEFAKVEDLPGRTRAALEVAVSGKEVPLDRLRQAGWQVRWANDVSSDVDSYWAYVRGSLGEFSVAKHVFVVTNCGWLSERTALYLAHGRPAVVQETGFSDHVRTGVGLLSFRDADEAAAALDEVLGDYARHAAAARELAVEWLDATVVLDEFLRDLGA